jgi:hypothetical protein
LLDTTGGKLTSTATLSFTSNADTILPPVKIDLRRSYIASVRHEAALYLDNSAKLGENQSIVTYNIKESKSFTGSGIKTINFDLIYNTDLLNFEPSLSKNLSSSDGKSFTLNGNPIKADSSGVLATVGFRVYLTKDSTTTIELIKRTDSSNVNCIISTLAQSGTATFDYNFLCGERSIAGFLNGKMPMKIVSIRPNPAQNELEIGLVSASKQDANIEIFDALGVKVFSEARNVSIGENKVHLDTQGLSSGVYLMRIGGASQSFVKSR